MAIFISRNKVEKVTDKKQAANEKAYNGQDINFA